MLRKYFVGDGPEFVQMLLAPAQAVSRDVIFQIRRSGDKGFH